MHKDKEENGMLPHIHTHAHDGYRTRELGAFEHGLLDGDMFLQVSDKKLPNYYIICMCLHMNCDINYLLMYSIILR